MKKEGVIFLFVAIIVVSGLLVEFFITYNQLDRTKLDPDYVSDLKNVVSWIKENTNENDIFFSEWKFGNVITGYADRKAIATSKVYPSEAKIVGERYKDLSRFFFSDNEYGALKLMEKYNASYVLVPTNFNFNHCRYIDECRPENYFFAENFAGSPRIAERSMIERLLKNKNLNYFRLVYSSRFFKIYNIGNGEKKSRKEEKILDSGFYDSADEIEVSFLSRPKKILADVQGGIVPHDTLYSLSQIGEFFNSLKENYTNVIIIGPDHYYMLNYFVVTTSRDWSTPFGFLEADTNTINKLKIIEDDYSIVKEHSIRFLLPFISHKYPKAKVVPLLIREDVDIGKYIELGKKVAEISNSSTLVLLSLDFSHIDSIKDTKLNTEYDLKSLGIIKELNMAKVPEMEVEAKAPIYVFLSAMNSKNATRIELINISNAIHKDINRSVGFITAAYTR